jgi:NADPH:quinone reductase-like Zn-dependent oxidoreductase
MKSTNHTPEASVEARTMSAAVYRRFGTPDVVRIEQLPKPSPGNGEVLVRVHATTVSAADYRARTKDVPPGLKLLSSFTLGFFRPRSRVLGMDVSGVIEGVGPGVTAFHPGDEVIAMLGGTFGGHAEYVTVAQDAAITLKPANLSFEEAAALVFGGITARAFLDRAMLTPGTSVLVNGASGSVGSAAVQLAHQAGARVTAVCSGGNAELVRSLGAGRVIDYTKTDFTLEAARYDIILDAVGNLPFDRLEPRIEPGGALLSVMSDLAGVVQASSRSRRTGKRITSGNVPFTSEQLAQVARLAEAGAVRPVIDQTFRLPDIADAHRYVDTGRKKGNVVVRVAAGGSGQTKEETSRSLSN